MKQKHKKNDDIVITAARTFMRLDLEYAVLNKQYNELNTRRAAAARLLNNALPYGGVVIIDRNVVLVDNGIVTVKAGIISK